MIVAGKVCSHCEEEHPPAPLADHETCSWCTRMVLDDRLIEQADGSRVCDECDETEEEEFHDGGYVLFRDGTVRPDCECGWSGTRTTDRDAAAKEREEHYKEATGS